MAPDRAALDPPLPMRRRTEPVVRHGGAWKVAYADFVTALMALFIVLWMMNASTRVKDSVQGYFRDPKGYRLHRGSGAGNTGESLALDQRSLRNLQKHLEGAFRQMPEFTEFRQNVLFTVTAEGLRVDLLENEQGMFFQSGNASPTPAGERLLNILAREVSRLPNKVIIEGHTDSSPFRGSTPSSGYSNWELASDRANTARRLLSTYGLHDDQIVETRGFANQHLLNSADPNDPRNRRISVVVKSTSAPGE